MVRRKAKKDDKTITHRSYVKITIKFTIFKLMKTYYIIIINIYIAQIPCEYDQMRVTNKYDTNQT